MVFSIDPIKSTAVTAVGGEANGEKIDGPARYPINGRFSRELRDS